MANELPIPQPTTLLQAVNILLDVISVGPVSSLITSDMNVDAKLALQAIHNSLISFQEEGWVWNTEENYPLSPDTTTGQLMLPVNTLKVDTSGVSGHLDLVPRGNRLYDRLNHTYKIGRPVRVTLVIALPFEELVQAARSYVTIVAARTFAQGRLGDGQTNQFTADMEYRARNAVENAQDQADDRTLFDTNPRLAGRKWFRRRS